VGVLKIQTGLLIALILCGLCITVSTVSADLSDAENNDTVPVLETGSVSESGDWGVNGSLSALPKEYTKLWKM